MKNCYPLFLFFVFALFATACQNDAATQNGTADQSSTETASIDVPDNTTIGPDWVRNLQGSWVLESDARSVVEIAGNTYTDKLEDVVKSTFKIEYSNGCKKCQSDMNLGKNKCLVLVNETNDISACLLFKMLSKNSFEIVNTDKLSVSYKYKAAK